MAEPVAEKTQSAWYCPQCREQVKEPLVCQDCLAVICRKCGTPLERDDELGIG